MWVKHRNTPQYHEGDLVWLEGRNLRTNQPTAKLATRRHSLFPVEQVLFPVTYKLSLPSAWNVHPVFHIDLLTTYRETPFHGENYQHPPAELVQGIEEYEVEAVLDMRHYGRKKKCQYLVKWKGYPDGDNEWVDHTDMHAPKAIKEYEEIRKDKSRLRSLASLSNTLMSSSPISVSSNSPTHLEILDALVATSASDLAEAQVAFPTPEPGCISPYSLDSAPLDLASTTVVHDTSLEADSLPAAEGTATQSKEEVGGLTEVLVLKYVGGEEGDSVVHCQNSRRGKCSFHGTNSQVCLTHGNRHIECGELLHNCKCASPTLIAPLPDILHYLPSTLGGTCQASEEPHTCNAATQTLERAMKRRRGVEENHRGQT